MSGSRRLIASLLALTSAAPGTAFAQGDKAAAVALFDEGRRAMEAGQYAEACPKLAESNRLDPQLGALLHLADCYEKVGQLASAWAAFRDAAELADRRADARSLSARGRASSLESRLSRLTIVVPEHTVVPGLEVRRDGTLLGAPLWGAPIPVDPGTHQVEVTAPGKLAWRQSVEVEGPGMNATVNVPVLANSAQPAAVPSASPSSGDSVESNPGSTQRLLGWVAIGASAIGIGVGTVFTVQRSNKLDERAKICPTLVGCSDREQSRNRELTSEARTAGALGAAGFIAAGALLAGGVALVLTAPDGSKTGLAPAVGTGFASLTLYQTW